MKSEKIIQIKKTFILLIGAVGLVGSGYFAGTRVKPNNQEDYQLLHLGMEVSNQLMAIETATLILAKDLKVSQKGLERMHSMYTSAPAIRLDLDRKFKGVSKQSRVSTLPGLVLEASNRTLALQRAILVMSQELKASEAAQNDMGNIFASVPRLTNALVEK